MTIGELPNKIFKLAVLEIKKQDLTKGRIDLDTRLQSSFVWDLSPQGNSFWLEIQKGKFNRYFLDKYEDSDG